MGFVIKEKSARPTRGFQSLDESHQSIAHAVSRGSGCQRFGLNRQTSDCDSGATEEAGAPDDRLLDRTNSTTTTTERVYVLLESVGHAHVVAMPLPYLTLEGQPAGSFGTGSRSLD
jgi:hypothetical protein